MAKAESVACGRQQQEEVLVIGTKTR